MLLTEHELSMLEKLWLDDSHIKLMESNWKSFESWIKVITTRHNGLDKLIDDLGDRIFIAPASTRVEYHNAFPGGFVDHSLRVLSTAINIASALSIKCDKESLITGALLHDIGKIGSSTVEYYIKNPSSWHKCRGQFFLKNEEIVMPNSQLGLFLMNEYNITLNQDEYLAILLNDGQYDEANKRYGMHEPALALIVHMADRWATQLEKNRKSLLDPAIATF